MECCNSWSSLVALASNTMVSNVSPTFRPELRHSTRVNHCYKLKGCIGGLPAAPQHKTCPKCWPRGQHHGYPRCHSHSACCRRGDLKASAHRTRHADFKDDCLSLHCVQMNVKSDCVEHAVTRSQLNERHKATHKQWIFQHSKASSFKAARLATGTRKC